MRRTWLVFDVNNLAWRAFHTTGHLRHAGNPTGVIYGVMKEVINCVRKFQATDYVFCFDKGKSLRAKNHPTYKASRRLRKLTDEEEAAREACFEQIETIRTSLIPRVGLGNTLAKAGYEADDMIAASCSVLPEGDRAIVVSGDHDLYQCISPNVAVYHPSKNKSLVTLKWFKNHYGMFPDLWAKVKAIAGCRSDDIEGVPGIGEKTACVYVGRNRDVLPKSKIEKIKSYRDLIRSNLRLTKLPYPGTPVPVLETDLSLDVRAWQEAMTEYGFSTLEAPGG